MTARALNLPPELIEEGDDVYIVAVEQWRYNVDMKSERGGKRYVRFKGDYWFVLLTQEKYLVLRRYPQQACEPKDRNEPQ
jgi:hypothetical protein